MQFQKTRNFPMRRGYIALTRKERFFPKCKRPLSRVDIAGLARRVSRCGIGFARTRTCVGLRFYSPCQGWSVKFKTWQESFPFLGKKNIVSVGEVLSDAVNGEPISADKGNKDATGACLP